MALFQFGKARDEAAAKLGAVQTVESMRRRAMHRLIGAAVLVLAGVIGFPLVFDNQPRPIPADLPIEIADKNKVKPLAVPAATLPIAATEPAAAPAPSQETPSAPLATAPASTPVASSSTAAIAPAGAKTTGPLAEAPVAKTADASKAQALLEGKDAANASVADGRFVVQVGAFAEQEKVREVRQKVEGAGLKTYTQVVQTKDGNRTRVRVGPFPDKEQAQKVAEKIRKLDLSVAILAL